MKYLNKDSRQRIHDRDNSPLHLPVLIINDCNITQQRIAKTTSLNLKYILSLPSLQ